MPDNPHRDKVGNKTGMFRVLIESREQGGNWRFVEYKNENVPYNEAFAAAGKEQQEFNKN